MATGKSVKKTETRKDKQLVFVVEWRVSPTDMDSSDLSEALETLGRTGSGRVVDVRVEEAEADDFDA